MKISVSITEAVDLLKHGDVVVYPTETVYGLGCDIYSKNAVKKIYEIKKRPSDKPLSIAVADFDTIEDLAFIPNRDILRILLSRPITVVLKKKRSVPDYITGNSNKIGIRLPQHPIAYDLIKNFGSPITSTSANISGGAPPKSIDQVMLDIPFIDGGVVSGIPSTVVDLIDKKIIRSGIDDDFVMNILKDFMRKI
ncbi:MAG TPA: threonylcarbamoyl-AMP synthase [Halobacteria archaeon]|jgi:L-threonylcarbamoyladenylate synthase|nr:threonylcarbamoyl-AMP synthase [Halobacteria archaeon]HIH77463.1 threonylcarbamoyl-AMP synthase [Halobacteria archaeon]